MKTKGKGRGSKITYRGPKIIYHGRSGYPEVHTIKSGRKYILVRARGGGVKRLYEGSRYYEEPTCNKGKRTWRILRLGGKG